MKRFVTRTMFLRLFLNFFVVVFLLNLVMGTLTFLYFKHTIQRREISRSQEALNQSKMMVESTIQEIQRTAMAISEDIAVRKILTLPEGNIRYTEAQSVIGLLEEKINSSNYLHSIYLYNEHIGKVISNNGIIDLDQFWDRSVIMKLSEGPPYGRWLVPHMITDLSGKQTNVITYALRIPEGENSDSYILININLQPFYQVNIPLFENTYSDVAIIDNQGRKIIYNDQSAHIDELTNVFESMGKIDSQGWFTRSFDQAKMFVIYVKSDFNGWLYIKASPEAEVFQASNLILRVMLAISLVCLLAGVVLVLLMSNRFYHPIYSFVQSVTGPAESVPALSTARRRTDDLALLRNTFNKLVEEREHVLEEIKQHEDVLKDHFLLNLLLGRENDPEEVLRSVRYYEMNLPESGCFVCLLHPSLDKLRTSDSPERNNIVTYQILRICQQLLDELGGGAVVPVDHQRIAMIVPAGQNSVAQDRFAKETAQCLRESIVQQVGISVSVGIGAPCLKLPDIHRSHEEASEALLYERIAGVGSIISICDIRSDNNGAKEWMECKLKIERLKTEIKLGGFNRAMELLAEILEGMSTVETNYRDKQILLSQLVYEMIMLMMELDAGLKGIYDGNPFSDYNSLETFDDIKDWLSRAVQDTLRYINDRRDNKNNLLMEQIVDYIHDCYREEITLQTVADKAFLNPQYFSKIFKEATGKTFLEYLTDIRLQAACQLLLSGKDKIYEISEQTGFGNKVNLMRAFKKHFKMTPSEYRVKQFQIHQSEDLSSI